MVTSTIYVASDFEFAGEWICILTMQCPQIVGLKLVWRSRNLTWFRIPQSQVFRDLGSTVFFIGRKKGVPYMIPEVHVHFLVKIWCIIPCTAFIFCKRFMYNFIRYFKGTAIFIKNVVALSKQKASNTDYYQINILRWGMMCHISPTNADFSIQ